MKTRKDFRNKKTGGKSYSKHCQNNGICEYCRSNRLYKNTKRIESTKILFKEIFS